MSHSRKNRQWPNFTELFDDFFNAEEFGLRSWGRFPAANVRETGASYVIDLVVPGRTKEDIKIHQEKDALVVSSELKAGEVEGEFRRREFQLAPFKRSFHLPEAADHENINASFSDGILTITIAKKEKEATVQREIKIS